MGLYFEYSTPQAMPSLAPESPVLTPVPCVVRRLPFIERPAPLRYDVAFVAMSLAFFAEKFVLPWVASHAPLAPLLAMILAVAYFTGPGPSLMATALCAVYMELFLFIPAGLGGNSAEVDNTRLLFFVMLGTLASWLSHRWCRSTVTLRDRE